MIEINARNQQAAGEISAAEDLLIISDGGINAGRAEVAESAIEGEGSPSSFPRKKIEPPSVYGWKTWVFRWGIGGVTSLCGIGCSVVLFYGSGQVTGEALRTLVFVALAASLNLVFNAKGVVDARLGGKGSWAEVSRLGNDARMASIAWGAMSVFFAVAFMTDGRIVTGDLRDANTLLGTTVLSIQNSDELMQRLEGNQVRVTNSNEIAILLDPWERSQSFWNALSSAVEVDGRDLAHAEQAASIGKIHSEVLVIDAYASDMGALRRSIVKARLEIVGLGNFAENFVWWSFILMPVSGALAIACYVFYRWNREPELLFFLTYQNYLDYERAYKEVHRCWRAKEAQSSENLELIGFERGRTARDDRWVENCYIEESWKTKTPRILGDEVASPPLAALRIHLGISENERPLGSKTAARLLEPIAIVGGLTLPTVAALLSTL